MYLKQDKVVGAASQYYTGTTATESLLLAPVLTTVTGTQFESLIDNPGIGNHHHHHHHDVVNPGVTTAVSGVVVGKRIVPLAGVS